MSDEDEGLDIDYADYDESPSRAVDDIDLLEWVKGSPLFTQRLLPDIESGRVFPALRNKLVSFYYMGTRLFSGMRKATGFTFITNRKFIPFLNSVPAVSEGDLSIPDGRRAFSDEQMYKEIKEKAKAYAKDEQKGLSYLVAKASPFRKPWNSVGNIVCLDTEIYLPGNKKDRIDLVLFNREKGELRFIEAKEYGNKELWQSGEGQKKVADQIVRYTDLLANRDDILASYRKYCECLKAFSVKLEAPVKLDPNCHLYIFGFDALQLEGKIKLLLRSDGPLKGIHCYPLGHASGVKPESVWSGSKLQK